MDINQPVQNSDDDSDDGIPNFRVNDGYDDAADKEGEQQMHNVPESQELKTKEQQDTKPRTGEDSPTGSQPIEDVRHRLEAEGSDQPVETQTLGSHQAQQQALDDEQGTETQAAKFGLRKGQGISGLKAEEANRLGRTSIEAELSLAKSNSQIDLSMLPDDEDDSNEALENSITSLSSARATFLPKA